MQKSLPTKSSLILYWVYKLNTWSQTQTYQACFYLGAVVFAVVSYVCQVLLDKPCLGVVPFLLRMIHHGLVFLLDFSVFAPTPFLPLEILMVGMTVGSWMAFSNKCLLTMLENRLCGYPKTRRFRDLKSYVSPWLDDFIVRIRIPMLTLALLVLLLRSYVAYRTNRVEIQGHRGARGYRPENSLAAFAYALDHGVTTLELDLQMTADGVLVIYHDPTINSSLCQKTGEGDSERQLAVGGRVRDMSLQEIQTYDCGSRVNPAFPAQTVSPQHIPTFTELLSFIRTNYPLVSVRLNVEIKTTPEADSDAYVTTFAATLVKVFEQEGLVASSIIQSFDVRALQQVKAWNPKIQTSYLVENLSGMDYQEIDKLVALCNKDGFDYVSPNFDALTASSVATFHQHGIKVLPWTVNSVQEMKRMVDMKVDGVITDYPVLMKEYLATN